MSRHWQAAAVSASVEASEKELPLLGGAGGLSAFFGLPLASAFLVLEAHQRFDWCALCTLGACLLGQVPHVDGAEFAMEVGAHAVRILRRVIAFTLTNSV